MNQQLRKFLIGWADSQDGWFGPDALAISIYPVHSPDNEHENINAYECAPFRYASNVKLSDTFWIKFQPYSLRHMLRDEILAGYFAGGPVTKHISKQRSIIGGTARSATIIVTGSNTGLGLEAARHFTRLNAEKVIIAVRNTEKGEAARENIEHSTGRKGVVEVWQLDLANYKSTTHFAKKARGLKRLDAVVENAGVAKLDWTVAEDDETTITVNVVSTFLLALNLLPKLRETASKFNITPHLVIVSSAVHFFTKFPQRNSASIFEKLNDKTTEDISDRYNVSKLLEVFYCRELASRTQESGKPDVIINFLNPGLCHSELAREAGLGLMLMKLFLARTAEQGSRTLVHAVESGTETHGQYLHNCEVATPARLVTDDEGPKLQKRVWNELSEKLEKIQPVLPEATLVYVPSTTVLTEDVFTRPPRTLTYEGTLTTYIGTTKTVPERTRVATAAMTRIMPEVTVTLHHDEPERNKLHMGIHTVADWWGNVGEPDQR
ncbi:MAG: hypothetical protein Q9217_000568 [Psora testacea]